MNRIFKTRLRIILIVIVFLPGLILFLAIYISPQFFLSKTKKVKANILIVEGWLPQYALGMAYKEFRNNDYDLIITTGIKSSNLDFCNVSMNGYLIFYPKLKSISNNGNDHHTIEVTAHSEMGGKYCAHFNFYVNDSLVADFKADKKIRKYGINWKGRLKNINRLLINFDNDMVDDRGDRNLYVKEIIIDQKIIIPYQFNSEYDIGKLDGKDKIINNFDSNAEIARNKLIAAGVDSSVVIAVPANKVTINRTLTSALAFRDWLKTTDKNVNGMNIISQGVHSRRTWMTYKKVIGKSYAIGIISLPKDEKLNSKRPGIFEILYEIIGLIYYSIILIPY